MKYIIFFIIFLPFITLAQKENQEIIAGEDIAVVQTESGKVRGYVHDGIYTYKGIPYAKAERFMPPEKVDPWTEEKFMGYYGATCPLDFEMVKARGNGVGMFALQNDWGYPHEDCQSLNIWTPGINDMQKRPVLLWIHGGGFSYGSSHELPFYDGKNLSQNGDIVLVSVNHRLNVLGFLDLSQYGEKYKYSANVGLLDLVTALNWIKQNISQFGGDPHNITLFGQSGGGAKINALLNSPVAKGLFHKAIIQSGSYTSEYLDSKSAQKISANILSEFELAPSQVDDLQKIPYHELLSVSKKAIADFREEAKTNGKKINASIWGPVRDNNFLPYGKFSHEALELSKDVAIMIGTTKSEFSIWRPSDTGEDMKLTIAWLKTRYKEKADSYMKAVLKAYPNTQKASDYIHIDFMFRRGAIRDAKKIVGAGHKNTYMYLFEWESPVNDGTFKSMHCMELPFVFNNISLGKELTGGGKEAYELADKVSSAWINFAKNGNPNANGLPHWPKYTIEEGATMIFNNQNEVRYHHDKELIETVMSAF